MAWVITIVEVAGGLALAAGYLVVPLSIWFAGELTMGIIMVHSHAGWFVVGGGRNGMEYSVVLVSCHIINANIAWALRKQPATA